MRTYFYLVIVTHYDSAPALHWELFKSETLAEACAAELLHGGNVLTAAVCKIPLNDSVPESFTIGCG